MHKRTKTTHVSKGSRRKRAQRRRRRIEITEAIALRLEELRSKKGASVKQLCMDVEITERTWDRLTTELGALINEHTFLKVLGYFGIKDVSELTRPPKAEPLKGIWSAELLNSYGDPVENPGILKDLPFDDRLLLFTIGVNNSFILEKNRLRQKLVRGFKRAKRQRNRSDLKFYTEALEECDRGESLIVMQYDLSVYWNGIQAIRTKDSPENMLLHLLDAERWLNLDITRRKFYEVHMAALDRLLRLAQEYPNLPSDGLHINFSNLNPRLLPQ